MLQYPDYFMLKLCPYIIACFNSFLTSSYCLLLLGFSLPHDVLFRLGSEKPSINKQFEELRKELKHAIM